MAHINASTIKKKGIKEGLFVNKLLKCTKPSNTNYRLPWLMKPFITVKIKEKPHNYMMKS